LTIAELSNLCRVQFLEEGWQYRARGGINVAFKPAGFKNNGYLENDKWLGHEAFAH